MLMENSLILSEVEGWGPNREAGMNRRSPTASSTASSCRAASSDRCGRTSSFRSVAISQRVGPDSYDFGRCFSGSHLWGIAATLSRDPHHRRSRVERRRSEAPAHHRVFATVVLLFVVTVADATLFDKCAAPIPTTC